MGRRRKGSEPLLVTGPGSQGVRRSRVSTRPKVPRSSRGPIHGSKRTREDPPVVVGSWSDGRRTDSGSGDRLETLSPVGVREPFYFIRLFSQSPPAPWTKPPVTGTVSSPTPPWYPCPFVRCMATETDSRLPPTTVVTPGAPTGSRTPVTASHRV